MSPKKILFICSSLEPGKDGVGDYTCKLAITLKKSGHYTAIIALNDRRMEGVAWQGEQEDDEFSLPVLRLSSKLDWQKRVEAARAYVADFNPDWISLQYVPFGYHLKGLPFLLSNRLIQIAIGAKWHIMFHELSVNREQSLKFRAWSFLQVKIIQHLVSKLKPAVIHTNTELYRYRLHEMGISATVLPLFSNISKIDFGKYKHLDQQVPSFLVKHRQNHIIGTLFGNFDYQRWDLESLLNKFTYGFTKKRVVITSIGRMSSGEHHWNLLKHAYPQIIFLKLGAQTPEFISYWLSSYTDFGLLTTLPELAGKSGSFMAFKEHGVPVLCKPATPFLAQLALPMEDGLTIIYENKSLQFPTRRMPVAQAEPVADKFLLSLAEGNGKKTVISATIQPTSI